MSGYYTDILLEILRKTAKTTIQEMLWSTAARRHKTSFTLPNTVALKAEEKYLKLDEYKRDIS